MGRLALRWVQQTGGKEVDPTLWCDEQAMLVVVAVPLVHLYKVKHDALIDTHATAGAVSEGGERNRNFRGNKRTRLSLCI